MMQMILIFNSQDVLMLGILMTQAFDNKLSPQIMFKAFTSCRISECCALNESAVCQCNWK